MTERDLQITNRLGLHARAAAKLVHTAGRFRCDVTLVKNGEAVDGKSILGIMALGAEQGSTISILCDGEDEDEAVAAIAGLIEDRFGEES